MLKHISVILSYDDIPTDFPSEKVQTLFSMLKKIVVNFIILNNNISIFERYSWELQNKIVPKT